MIFGIWYIAWIVVATSAVAFLIPYCAVVARGTYVKRRVEFLYRVHLFVLASVFIFLWLGEDLRYAVIMTLKVGGFMALMVHYAGRDNVAFLGRLPRFLASAAFVKERYFRVVAQRREDFEFAVRQLTSQPGGSWWKQFRKKVWLSILAVRACTTDLVRLVNQVSTIIEARGGFPHPRIWRVEKQRRMLAFCFAMGDVLLICILIAPVVGGLEGLFPEPAEEIVRWLQARWPTTSP